MRKLAITLALVVMMGWAHAAHATPIQWTLSGVTMIAFPVETFVSGSFDYDADTNLYSSISLTSTGAVPASFQFLNPFIASDASNLNVVSSNPPVLGNTEFLFLSF